VRRETIRQKGDRAIGKERDTQPMREADNNLVLLDDADIGLQDARETWAALGRTI